MRAPFALLGLELILDIEFLVDGKAIPDVGYDVGESYAGQMPLGNSTDNLFFWFFPSTNAAAKGEILIWMNGGVSLNRPASLQEMPLLTTTTSSPDALLSRVSCKRMGHSFGRLAHFCQSRTPMDGTA